MTVTDSTSTSIVPQEIAEQIILPEGHLDEVKLYQAYRWLRQNLPLGKAKVEGYDDIWLVSKHADIMEIGRQSELFSNNGGKDKGSHNPILQTQEGDAFTKTITGGSLRFMNAMIDIDDPEHTLVRNIGAEWFRPGQLAKWEQQIRALGNATIDNFLKPGANELDFVKDFALYYPLHVIMTLFGMPEEDEPRMMALTQELFGPQDPDTIREDVEPLSPEAAARQFVAALQDFNAYFDGLLEDRRTNPRDDLATVIACAKQEDGEYVEDKYAHGWFFAIATAGHDTTSSTMSAIFEVLAENPDLLATVQADPSKINGLVTEGLRWTTPIKHFMRRAEADATVNEMQIKKGDRLMLLYQSGNRDEDVFDAPDEFRIDRSPNKHVAFGYGPHMCIGQHLAKMELRIMFEELLPRISNLKRNGERKVVMTNFVGGLRNLPVSFDLV